MITKVIRSVRKSLSLQILPNSTLVVKAPFYIPQREIDRFIDKNKDWIEKRLKLLSKTSSKLFINGEQFPYLGENLKLEIGDYKNIAVSGEKILFPSHLVFRAEKELQNWYLKQSKLIVEKMLDKYSQEFKTTYKEVRYSDTKSKWGSCTQDNRLQFNWRLIMAPFLVVRYVVVHELAHTLEKNHSQSFWVKVRGVNPSYRQQIKWLNENGNALFSIFPKTRSS
jgi:predicted metal-dependent hydrolase